MSDTLQIVIYSCFAGLPIFIGGLLSSMIKLKRSVNNWIIAFGGGALLAAVVFALIPKALELGRVLEIAFIFMAGTFTFMFVDIMIARSEGSLSQLMSMMMDYVPEALALGASFAHDPEFGLLLAIFIGIQNFPEGFNSYLELSRTMSRKATLLLMFGLSFVGVAAALAGDLILSDYPRLIAAILLYAGGGILYLIFQDIAPLSHADNDWVPATGASFGFLLGMLGEKLM